MKGYLIDAGARTIAPIDYEYHTMRKWLPGGLDVAARFANGDVLYVDGEALRHPAKVAFRFKRLPDGQPMMSNGILTGRDNPEAEEDDRYRDGTLPPEFTIEEIQAEIEWMDLDEALTWFRERENEPAVTLTADGKQQVISTWADFLSMMTRDPA